MKLRQLQPVVPVCATMQRLDSSSTTGNTPKTAGKCYRADRRHDIFDGSSLVAYFKLK